MGDLGTNRLYCDEAVRRWGGKEGGRKGKERAETEGYRHGRKERNCLHDINKIALWGYVSSSDFCFFIINLHPPS